VKQVQLFNAQVPQYAHLVVVIIVRILQLCVHRLQIVIHVGSILVVLGVKVTNLV